MLPTYADHACAYAHARLERELPAELSYHTVHHTARDVVPAALRLATLAAVSAAERTLLRTAAWYHDIGYLHQSIDHELASVRLVVDILPTFGYRPDQIEIIIGMILATRLPQTPRTHLDALLADADLDALGRDDFLPLSLALREEFAVYGSLASGRSWYEQQRRFIQSHSYHSAEAQALRNAGKERNIVLLERLIADTSIAADIRH